MNRAPRKRRYLAARRLPWLRLLGFRYSYPHDAYILVLVGQWVGPVFRDESHRPD